MFEQYGWDDGSGSHPSLPGFSALWPPQGFEQHGAAQQPLIDAGAMDTAWDPTQELAHLLQEAGRPGQAETTFVDHFGTADTHPLAGTIPEPAQRAGEQLRPPTGHGHRRTPPRSTAGSLLGTGSVFTAVLVAVIAAVVSVFSGLAICDALRHSAGPHTTQDIVSWWPLLIYGPWVVASLSILRAALHQRRAVHSWSIVLLFSTLATLLCVAQAPGTFAARAAATLPPIAALACFQQLVRQITLTRPPRQPVPRHRGRTLRLLRQPTVV
ncbi:DUF2637 domain-containing protein [Streptomyces sp. NPDC091259]|uniref:DUF2637 domain-containing protein n=1 Tax=Streptomyces sp. NPDC091259 TaxID=3365976 RepID=UPI003817F607